MTFVCKDCNYEFNNKNRENKKAPIKCPYCGTDGSISEKRHILLDL